jgi:hypothetical protein
MTLYSPKGPHYASRKTLAENKPGPREGIKAKGQFVPGRTYWPDEQPPDLDDARAIAELRRDERRYANYGKPNPRQAGAYAEWQAGYGPIGCDLDGLEFQRRWLKAILHLPPRHKPDMRRCIDFCRRTWPRVTNIDCRGPAGERVAQYRYLDAKWKALRPGHPDYLY